ncbi:MAG: MFS transporter [Armatimonadota bacterium]
MSENTSKHDSEMLVPLNKRNYWLTVINGIMAMTGGRLMDLRTVLPLLMVRLTGRAWTVGLLETMFVIAPAIPQLIAARWVDTLECKRPQYARYSVYRFLALAALTASVLAADFIPNIVVAILFFFFFTIRYAAQGMTTLCFRDIIAKSVPTTRRGTLWMWRWIGGITMIFLVAVPTIRYLLGDVSPLEFPLNYGALLASGTLVMGIGWVVFSQIDEPDSRPAKHTLTWSQHFARSLRVWRRDAKFRRFVVIRMTLVGAGAIRPFFIAFGAQVWGLPDVVAAVFVTIEAISQGLGALVGGHISDRVGNRAVLLLAGSMIFITAFGAVLLAQFVPEGVFEIFGYALSYRVVALALCYTGGGAFASIASTGYTNYMLDIAPQRMRPSYMAFERVFISPVGFIPICFGWLVDAVSYQLVFGIGAALSAVAIFFAVRLDEPRDELSEEELDEFR